MKYYFETTRIFISCVFRCEICSPQDGGPMTFANGQAFLPFYETRAFISSPKKTGYLAEF
jgi:hypothetical protein